MRTMTEALRELDDHTLAECRKDAATMIVEPGNGVREYRDAIREEWRIREE